MGAGASLLAPTLMKDLMPNVKLFMFVTDPVDRMFSHIKESFKDFTRLFSVGITI